MTDPTFVIKLIDAICVSWDNPDYYPVFENGVLKTTFCNRFVNDVAVLMGYNGFIDQMTHEPMVADDMLRIMATDKLWQEIPCPILPEGDMKEALWSVQVWANQGYLTIAGLSGAALGATHGHVCIIRPGLMKSSGKWGAVPSVANCGREQFIGRAKSGPMKGQPVGLNEAFIPMPKFYSLKPEQI